MVEVGEHYRAPEGAVYRVVGTGAPLRLLRVTDGDRGRVSTGELRSVDRERLAEGFEPAANPDEGPNPVRAVVNAAQGVYWGVRRLL